MVIEAAEIRSIIDYHLPRTLYVPIDSDKETAKKMDEVYRGDREAAIDRSVADISRRIKERTENE